MFSHFYVTLEKLVRETWFAPKIVEKFEKNLVDLQNNWTKKLGLFKNL